MTYVYTPSGGFGIFRPERCAASVGTREYFPRSFQCKRKATIQEEGHGWCATHAPSAMRKRREESAAKFKAQVANSPAVRLGVVAKERDEARAEIELLRQSVEGSTETILKLRAALEDLLELHEDEPNRPAVQVAREVLGT